MKKISSLLIFAALGFASNSYAVDATVAQSGAWTSPATWGGTETPATTLGALSFANNNMTLTVDTNASVASLVLFGSAAQSQNISINKDKTLTFTSADALNAYLASSASFSGDGNVAFTGGINVVKGTYVFDCSVSSTGELAFKDNATTLTVNADSKFGSLTFQTGATFNINAAVTMGRFNGWNGSATLNMSKGSSLTVNGAFAMTKGNINGTITSSGNTSKSSSEEAYTLSLGRRDGNVAITLGEFADISSTSTSSSAYARIRQCTLTVNSAANSFRTKSQIMLTAANITMNSSNVFNGGGATSQATTRFIIGKDEKLLNTAASNAKFILNKTNDFGTFEFVRTDVSGVITNSYVTFDLKNAVAGETAFTTIGKLLIFGSTNKLDSGVAYLKLDNLTDFTVKISDITSLTYNAIDGDSVLETGNIVFKDGETYSNAYLIKDDNGGYWVNTSAVPEPATVAAILGALALGIAVYRKRK